MEEIVKTGDEHKEEPSLTEGTKPDGETSGKQKALQRKKRRNRRLRDLRDLLVRTALLGLVVYVLFFHLVGVTVMPNGDMYPRIDSGDLVLFYRLEKEFRAQDVIVCKVPSSALALENRNSAARDAIPEQPAVDAGTDPEKDAATLFVLRVVAAPGDTVEISDSERLIVNGNTMSEPNIFYNTPQYLGFVDYPLTLGDDEYFVLADSRQGGADSRFFGAVKKDEILGTVITIVRRNNL